jgi:indoleamine 2,3-dioxygenase
MVAQVSKGALAEELDGFDVDSTRGFLPSRDPLLTLPGDYAAWEEIAARLPALLVNGRVVAEVDALPVIDPAGIDDGPALERAMLLLSYFGHAYVWGDENRPPPTRLPAGLAVPWHAVASRLGRPPVLAYASYALTNWRRLDADRPVALGNLVLLQQFLGGLDEEWFILVHVDIECRAGAAMRELLALREAARQGDVAQSAARLARVNDALAGMNDVLARMPEGCDPYVYFRRVRPYIHGWKDHPALPDGMVYEGVDAYGGRPQRFRGETGAQSTIIPCLDAALGVEHSSDPLSAYLREMRDYAPTGHRAFLAELERDQPLRSLVLARAGEADLRDAYNQCLEEVHRFRATHLQYAALYIHKQSQSGVANPNAVGTGGTPFMDYLSKHRNETSAHLVD